MRLNIYEWITEDAHEDTLSARPIIFPLLTDRLLIDTANDIHSENDGNDDGDDDDDDDYGRDAVGVSHAAPPRLRPPDNGNLGGATYTSCIYTLYIATYMSRIHSVFYTAVYNVYAAH